MLTFAEDNLEKKMQPSVDIKSRLTVTVLAVRAGVLLSFPGCSLCVCVGVYSVRACSATVLGPV